MNAAIILIILGIIIWIIVPNFISGSKKNKARKQKVMACKVIGWLLIFLGIYKPEFGISDCRFSCYARFPIGAYYICPPNNMDGKMQEL